MYKKQKCKSQQEEPNTIKQTKKQTSHEKTNIKV